MKTINNYSYSKRSIIISILLIFIMLLSGFNFLNQLKIGGMPLFQLSVVSSILILIIFAKKIYNPSSNAVKYFRYYIIFSVFPYLIGVLFNPQATITFIYLIFPYLLFILTYRKIDNLFYEKLLFYLNISMLLVTIVGWLIRLGIINFTALYDMAPESEFLIGYWGIRYLESTRNADYLYPLIGLGISIFFFQKKRNIFYLIPIAIYEVSLIASMSRTALIIAFLSLVFLYIFSDKKTKIIFSIFIILIIVLNFKFIYEAFESNYSAIIMSIFSLESTENRFSNTSRLKVIEYAVTASVVNPFGYGLDNYHAIYEIFNIDDRVSYSAENAFLTILVERGWFAFLSFIFFFWLLLKRAYSIKSSLNKLLVPMLFIYFLFNYELNNVFACFIFYILLLDYHISTIQGTK